MNHSDPEKVLLPNGNASSGFHVDVLVAHSLGPVLGRFTLKRSPFL